MRQTVKLLFLLLVVPSLAFAQSYIYEVDQAKPTDDIYGAGQACFGPTNVEILACSEEGYIFTTPGPAPTLTNATFAAIDTTAGGAGFGAAYAALLTPAASTKVLIFVNATDGDVVISMDAGTTDHFYLSANQTLTLDLAQHGLTTAAAIHGKDGDTASTTGNFRIMSYK